MLTKNITKYFKDPIRADQVAAEMQAQDQDWKYVSQHCPKGTGFSFIKSSMKMVTFLVTYNGN